MAATETFVPNQLYEMPLADLQADPNQPRKYLDAEALDELTASIKEQKVISPIVFRVEGGICYVVAGERRCIAARKAGFTTIPAIFSDSPNYAAIAIAENIVRADLTPVEEAEALARLMKSLGCTQEDLTRIIGKTKGSISQTLSISRLPQTILDDCRKDPSVPKRVLIGITAKKQERSMLKAYETYKASVATTTKSEAGDTVTEAQRIIKAMDAVGKKIEAIEPRNLYQEEKQDLIAALNVLKGLVENGLTALTDEAIEEAPTAEPAAKAAAAKKKKAVS